MVFVPITDTFHFITLYRQQ